MFRKISNIVIALFLVCALGVLGVVGVPLLMGNKLYAVLTQSMEPTYPVGSIVVVKPAQADEIKVDDVITFNLESFDTPITHRVLDVDPESRYFITKGDNNNATDPFPVSFDELEGKVEFGIPYLGTAVTGMRTTGGKLVIAWVVLFLKILLFLPDILDKNKKAKAEEAENKQINDKHSKTKRTKQNKKAEKVYTTIPAVELDLAEETEDANQNISLSSLVNTEPEAIDLEEFELQQQRNKPKQTAKPSTSLNNTRKAEKTNTPPQKYIYKARK